MHTEEKGEKMEEGAKRGGGESHVERKGGGRGRGHSISSIHLIEGKEGEKKGKVTLYSRCGEKKKRSIGVKYRRSKELKRKGEEDNSLFLNLDGRKKGSLASPRSPIDSPRKTYILTF